MTLLTYMLGAPSMVYEAIALALPFSTTAVAEAHKVQLRLLQPTTLQKQAKRTAQCLLIVAKKCAASGDTEVRPVCLCLCLCLCAC